jgi:hypothetical protein
MRFSKLARNTLNYLPVLVVLVATGLGLFLGKGLYPKSLASQYKTPTHLSTEPNNSQPLTVLGAVDPCRFSPIYTSLPPKCKSFDGKFIPLPGLAPNFFAIP